MNSPYDGLEIGKWKERTRKLIREHPLEPQEIVGVVHDVWAGIFDSKIGTKPFKIGKDLFPKGQVMSALLHELLPLEFQSRYPAKWRREETAKEKDLVCLENPRYSIEIKASSSASGIFGNRSYAQDSKSPKKVKSGYVLAINFQSFSQELAAPKVRLIRFGWLDHVDWIGQKSETGQSARPSKEAKEHKLLKLPLE